MIRAIFEGGDSLANLSCSRCGVEKAGTAGGSNEHSCEPEVSRFLTPPLRLPPSTDAGLAEQGKKKKTGQKLTSKRCQSVFDLPVHDARRLLYTMMDDSDKCMSEGAKKLPVKERLRKVALWTGKRGTTQTRLTFQT